MGLEGLREGWWRAEYAGLEGWRARPVAPKSESCELDANSLKSAKRDGGVVG